MGRAQQVGFKFGQFSQRIDGEIDAFVLLIVVLQIVEGLDLTGRVHQIAGTRDLFPINWANERDGPGRVAWSGLYKDVRIAPMKIAVVMQNGGNRKFAFRVVP